MTTDIKTFATKSERNSYMLSRYKEGLSYQEIAQETGISRQRIQIILTGMEGHEPREVSEAKILQHAGKRKGYSNAVIEAVNDLYSKTDPRKTYEESLKDLQILTGRKLSVLKELIDPEAEKYSVEEIVEKYNEMDEDISHEDAIGKIAEETGIDLEIVEDIINESLSDE